MEKAIKSQSECKFRNLKVYVNEGTNLVSLFPSHLLPVQQLKPELQSSLVRLYGTPDMDNLLDGRILLGKDIEVETSESGISLHKAFRAMLYRSLGISDRPTGGSQLSKTKNYVKHENRSRLPECLEEAYSVHCVFHRKSGTRVLSRNQFYELWQCSPMCSKLMVDTD